MTNIVLLFAYIVLISSKSYYNDRPVHDRQDHTSEHSHTGYNNVKKNEVYDDKKVHHHKEEEYGEKHSEVKEVYGGDKKVDHHISKEDKKEQKKKVYADKKVNDHHEQHDEEHGHYHAEKSERKSHPHSVEKSEGKHNEKNNHPGKNDEYGELDVIGDYRYTFLFLYEDWLDDAYEPGYHFPIPPHHYPVYHEEDHHHHQEHKRPHHKKHKPQKGDKPHDLSDLDWFNDYKKKKPEEVKLHELPPHDDEQPSHTESGSPVIEVLPKQEIINYPLPNSSPKTDTVNTPRNPPPPPPNEIPSSSGSNASPKPSLGSGKLLTPKSVTKSEEESTVQTEKITVTNPDETLPDVKTQPIEDSKQKDNTNLMIAIAVPIGLLCLLFAALGIAYMIKHYSSPASVVS